MYSFFSTPISSISAAARLTFDGRIETFGITSFSMLLSMVQSPSMSSYMVFFDAVAAGGVALGIYVHYEDFFAFGGYA